MIDATKIKELAEGMAWQGKFGNSEALCANRKDTHTAIDALQARCDCEQSIVNEKN